MASGSTTPVPVQMPAGVTFVSVRGGLRDSLALDRDGKVWAWGYDHAVLDPDDSPVRDAPVRVDMPDGVSFTHVSGDSGYVLALDSDSNAWESTSGGEGGSASSGFTLVDLPAGVSATIISARGHSLVLDQDGNAWAWRDNMFGQLGDVPGRVGDVVLQYAEQVGRHDAQHVGFALEVVGIRMACARFTRASSSDHSTRAARQLVTDACTRPPRASTGRLYRTVTS